MSLWRRIRDEAAGAWRSVRYDLDRRAPGPAAAGSGHPDVTGTGLNTFPGPRPSPPRAGDRPLRRFAAITAFCLLALLGSGASYLVATSVFSPPRGVVPEAAPQAGDERPAPVDQADPSGRASMGTVPASSSRPRKRPPAAPATGTAPPGTPRSAGPAPATTGRPRTGILRDAAPATSLQPRPARVSPERTRRANRPPCDCRTPPVPTPTAPSGSPDPSAAPSGSTGAPAGPAGPVAPAPPGDAAAPSASDGGIDGGIDGGLRTADRP